MKFIKSIPAITLCLFLNASISYAAGWDYIQHGDDWTGTCSSGSSQSPIDIVTSNTQTGSLPVAMEYTGRSTLAENNGHTVQFNPEARSITVKDNVSGALTKFTLLQFHLHNGSEHTVDGQRAALEAHFVHANAAYIAGDMANARLTVIGVLLQPGASGNAVWDTVLLNLPAYDHTNGLSGKLQKLIGPDYYSLLIPQTGGAWTYEGSLTTPTCDEIVNWIVLQAPVTVSQAAVDSFLRHRRMNTPHTAMPSHLTAGW